MTTPPDSDLVLARQWLSDTPYVSFHPGVPSNLPMTIATPEKIASLAALIAQVRQERDAALDAWEWAYADKGPAVGDTQRSRDASMQAIARVNSELFHKAHTMTMAIRAAAVTTPEEGKP